MKKQHVYYLIMISAAVLLIGLLETFVKAEVAPANLPYESTTHENLMKPKGGSDLSSLPASYVIGQVSSYDAQIAVASDYPTSCMDMVGKVPFFYQTGDTCGAYALKEVLWWWGRTDVQVDDIHIYLGKDEGPYWSHEMSSVIIHWLGNDDPDNFDPNSGYGGNPDYATAKEVAKSWICANAPVICCIKTDTFTYHYVVLLGYDDVEGCWYLHDTAPHFTNADGSGYDVKVSYDEFGDHWHHAWTPDPFQGMNQYGGLVFRPGDFNHPYPAVEITGLSDCFDNEVLDVTVSLSNSGSDNAVSENVLIWFYDAELVGTSNDISWTNFDGYETYDDSWNTVPYVGGATAIRFFHYSGFESPWPSGQPSMKLEGHFRVRPMRRVHDDESLVLHYRGGMEDEDDKEFTHVVGVSDDRPSELITILGEPKLIEAEGYSMCHVTDDDPVGPSFSNPLSTYVSSTEAYRIQIDATDDSGISWLIFRYEFEVSGEWDWSNPSGTLGNTYWYDIPKDVWILHSGQAFQWRAIAEDGDNDNNVDSEITFSTEYSATMPASYLQITAESPVNVLVTDPNGLRVGYDPVLGVLNEILGASYSGPGTEPQNIRIPNPVEGMYRIDAFGMGTGAFTITVESFTVDGSLVNSRTWTGTAEPGEQYSQEIEVEPDGAVKDATPPTTHVTLEGTLGSDGWYTSSVIVTLEATDDMSGIAATQYSLDNVAWISYSDPFTIEDDETYTVHFLSIDNDGNTELSQTISFKIDQHAPSTALSIGEPKHISDKTYVTLDTPFTLKATDTMSGVYSTTYRIYDATYDSGWQTYTAPFKLALLTDGTYTIEYKSTDNAGNIETPHTVSVVLDNTGPTATVLNPPSGWALQDGVTFIISAADVGSGVHSVNASIRIANGGEGQPCGFEDLPATYNEASGKWTLFFDTLQLPDGYYTVLAETDDNLGNIGEPVVVPYSIRNWAVIELLPSTAKNKAGRTMPVKFSLRVAAAVDPTQPFVYNEELTIKIYATNNPSNILQTSTYGTGARNYRIDVIGEKYITNFKTLPTPKQYTVTVNRNTFVIGSFNFQTVP